MTSPHSNGTLLNCADTSLGPVRSKLHTAAFPILSAKNDYIGFRLISIRMTKAAASSPKTILHSPTAPITKFFAMTGHTLQIPTSRISLFGS